MSTRSSCTTNPERARKVSRKSRPNPEPIHGRRPFDASGFFQSLCWQRFSLFAFSLGNLLRNFWSPPLCVLLTARHHSRFVKTSLCDAFLNLHFLGIGVPSPWALLYNLCLSPALRSDKSVSTMPYCKR